MTIERSAPHSRRIPSLDGLRTLSIALVLLGHVYHTAHYPHNSLTLFLRQFSHLGVEIFFVISGFLITTLLLKEKARTGRVDFFNFYLRRTLRIFPAAFFFITVMAIVAHPGYLLYAYTYTMCYAGAQRPWVLSHLWSLSVEEQFYLLWPVAMVFGFKRRWLIGGLVLVVAALSRFLFWRAGMDEALAFSFPAVADDLMMGCLLAFGMDLLRKHFSWLTHPAVFAILSVLVFCTPRLGAHPKLFLIASPLVPLLIALMIFSAIERADRFLNNPFTSFFGVLSYSLYLWQQPFLNRNIPAWWTEFPVNVLLAIAVAIGSYYVIERPFLRMFRSERAHILDTETATS